MTRSRSVIHLVIWSAAAALSVAGCSGPGTTGGSTGTGGAGAAGATGSGGSLGGSGGSSGQGGGAGSGGSAGAGTAGADAGATGGAGTGGTGGGGTGGGTGGSGTSGMSAGCGTAPTIPSSQYNNGKPISITAANMQRRYILSVPTNYDNKHAYRLVISFHQRDGNDIQNYSWQYYGLLPLANNTTIFVAPNGQLNGAPCAGTGNGETGCGWPNPNNSDLALADAVVAQIEASFCVDTNRIFATGWSFGGAMSYETACARPLGATNGYLRAIAVYSGSAQITAGPCPPHNPVAYYASHGTNDNVLPYAGGVSMAQSFATANGCTWAAPTQATGSHVCTNLAGCMSGYPVEFCSFVGPHTPFPDTGQNPGSWGPGEAWKFLSQF
jgi:poly(3-hydroxybutyrate) depolymerase